MECVDVREFIEYICIGLHLDTDLEELENHLAWNGYNFGIDKNRYRLFVFVDEVDYVETILNDRDIIYETYVY